MGSDAMVAIGVLLMLAGMVGMVALRPRTRPLRRYTVTHSDGTVRVIWQ